MVAAAVLLLFSVVFCSCRQHDPYFPQNLTTVLFLAFERISHNEKFLLLFLVRKQRFHCGSVCRACSSSVISRARTKFNFGLVY